MTPNARKLGVLAFAVVFAVAGLVVIEGTASSASDAPLWRWQDAIADGRGTELVSTTSSGDQIALVAVRDVSDELTLIVRANGQDVQKAPASGIASGAPLAAFVVGDSAGTQAILGLARADAAHVFLITSGATAQELPLNGSGAFAAAGLAPGTDAELEAVGFDGATVARVVLPSAGGICGGALGVCNGKEGRRAHGTIAWLLRHEPRGKSPAQAGIRITRTVGSHWQPVRFARVLMPDPHSRAQIVLSLIGKRGLNVCMTVFPSGAKATNDQGGGGCAVGLTLTPLSTIIGYGGGRGYIAGAAADRVARITLQLRDGSPMRVPLSDNVFFLHIPSGVTPRTLLSFDRNGDLIGRDNVPPAAVPGGLGARLGSSPPRRPQATRAVHRYTISNRGRLVPGHGNKIFEGHPYQLFLLGTLSGRAYYRIQLTAHFTCWGSGPADKVGSLGTSGCPGVVGAYPLQLDDNVVELKRGARTPHFLRLAGIVADQAASVALRDANGKTIATVPVEHNLFALPPPFPNDFVRPVPLDANGKALLPHPEWGQHQTPPPNFWGPRAQKVGTSQLGAVVQHGEARGVKVAVSENGVVVFDTRGIDPDARRALTGTKAWFACFQLSGQNVRHNRSAGISSTVAPEVALRMVGIKPHYDGCEAGGSYGHRWHDQHGPHSTIEIGFTQQGNRYFEDRATARDLAAFVRSAKMQSIRRKTGAALVTAIRKVYGNEVRIVASATGRPAPGQIGVWNRGARTIFSEVSHLGDRLFAEFDNGKLTKQNVRGLAFVF